LASSCSGDYIQAIGLFIFANVMSHNKIRAVNYFENAANMNSEQYLKVHVRLIKVLRIYDGKSLAAKKLRQKKEPFCGQVAEWDCGILRTFTFRDH